MVFWSSGKKVEKRQEGRRVFLRGQRGGLGLEGLRAGWRLLWDVS